MPTNQFALGAFDSVKVFHPLLESVAVLLPDEDRPVLLRRTHTLRAEGALRTMVTPLESKAHLAPKHHD